jgi:nitroreductase
MNEQIREILNTAVTAPSPDNFQPWRFEVRNNQVDVFKVPGKVNHLLDCNEHVLLFTNGMLIENILIAASHAGVRCQLSLLPDASQKDLVARIFLEKDNAVREDALYPYLKLRCTNRKTYKKTKVADTILAELKKIQNDFSGVELKIVTAKSEIKQLGKAVSAIDQIMFQNRPLHDSLFEHVTWSKKEEEKTRQGLALDAMEFDPMEKMLFRGLKNWNLVRLLDALGLTSFIRFKNSKQYGSCPASVMVAVEKNNAENYLAAGRMVERFWLLAASLGLNLHPIVGVIYCFQKVNANEKDVFSDAQSKLLTTCYQQMRSIASANQMKAEHLVFFSRLGYAPAPSHKSLRKEAEINFL